MVWVGSGVFELTLNEVIESELCMFGRREFKRVGAAVAKALPPICTVLDLVTGVRRLVLANHCYIYNNTYRRG